MATAATTAEESGEEIKKRKLNKIIEDKGYVQIQEIGYGGFGSVSEVKVKEDGKNGRHFAMKIILNPNIDDDSKEKLKKKEKKNITVI